MRRRIRRSAWTLERLLWRWLIVLVCLGLLAWGVAPIVGAYAGSLFAYKQDGYGDVCSWPGHSGVCVTTSTNGGIIPEVDTTWVQPQPPSACPSYPEGCSGPNGFAP